MGNTLTAPSKLEQDAFFYNDAKSSKKGKIIHKLMELKIKKMVGQLKDESAKQQATAEFNKIESEVTEEYQEIAQSAAEFVLKDYKQIKMMEPEATIQTERWIHLHQFIRGGKGKVDVVIVTPTIVHLIDLKTGSYPVLPDSSQMKAYTAGMATEYPDHRIIVTIIQDGKVRTKQMNTFDVIEWAHDVGQRIQNEKVSKVTSQAAKELMQLLNKIQQIKDQDIDSDLLIALDEARAVKDAVFNRANKMASEGKEYEGIEYSGTFMSRFVDMLIIAEWMRRKGYAPEEIAKIGKVQKGPLTKVLTHNDYEELKRLGMMDEYTSTKTLKVKR